MAVEVPDRGDGSPVEGAALAALVGRLEGALARCAAAAEWIEQRLGEAGLLEAEARAVLAEMDRLLDRVDG